MVSSASASLPTTLFLSFSYLLSSGHTLRLVTSLPQLDVSEGLGQLSLNLLLGFILLVQMLLENIQLVLQILHLAEQVDPLPGLGVGQPLGVLQLRCETGPVLAQQGRQPLRLLELLDKVAVLHSQLPLGAVRLVQRAGDVVLPRLVVVDLGLDHLPRLLQPEPLVLLVDELVLHVLQLQRDRVTLLLGLGLQLVEAVDLVAELGDGGVVLLPEHGESGLVRDVALVQLHLQLGELLLLPRVERDLRRCVSPRLLQLLVDVVQLVPERAARLVRARPAHPLGLEVLVYLV